MSGTEPCIEEVRNCWINVNQLCKFKRMMWHSCCASFPRHSMWLWRGAPEVNMSWASLLHLSSSWALPVHTGKSWWKQLWRWSLVLSCASVRETFSGYFRNLRTQLFCFSDLWMLKRSLGTESGRPAVAEHCAKTLPHSRGRSSNSTLEWKDFVSRACGQKRPPYPDWFSDNSWKWQVLHVAKWDQTSTNFFKPCCATRLDDAAWWQGRRLGVMW